jgi:cobalt transporter subunit CbtA
MIQRMLTSAVVAGGVAGLFAALLHFAFIQDKILLAEQYEDGALVHFTGAAPAAHSHGDAPAEAASPEAAAESHDQPAPATSDLKRNALTVAFSALIYVAYALILIAGFALATLTGRKITAREGALWGIAGFAAFQMAPAMGLAPELPGTLAADLAVRQLWWWGTVAATAGGLALIAYGRGIVMAVLAIVLLAAPHVIGAPELEGFFGVAPPELAAGFAASVLGVGLTVWTVMGALAGRLWSSTAAS